MKRALIFLSVALITVAFNPVLSTQAQSSKKKSATEVPLITPRTPQQIKEMRMKYLKRMRGEGLYLEQNESDIEVLFNGKDASEAFSKWFTERLLFPNELFLFPEAMKTVFVFNVSGDSPKAYNSDLILIITPSLVPSKEQIEALKKAVQNLISKSPSRWEIKPKTDNIDVDTVKITIALPVIFTRSPEDTKILRDVEDRMRNKDLVGK